MAEITRYIKHRRDTAANWTSNNPILKAGQLGIETDGLTTTPKFKIGDGVTAWTGLPYFYGGTASAQDLANVLSLGGSATSLALKNVISDETGSGALVFGTQPTFTQWITVPRIYGGTGATDGVDIFSTSGVGTGSATAVTFRGGNNGATIILTMLNDGTIRIPNNRVIQGIDSGGTNRSLITWSAGDNITITGRPGTTDIVLNPTSGGVGLYVKSGGDGGIGVASPSARWHIVKTTEQLRVGYDTSNYLSTTISSTGEVTNTITGTTRTFNFTSAGSVAMKVTSTAVTTYLGSDGSGGYVGTNTAHAFRVLSANTERLNISTAGVFTFGSTNQTLVFTPTATAPTLVQNGSASSTIQCTSGTVSGFIKTDTGSFLIGTGSAHNTEIYYNNIKNFTLGAAFTFTDAVNMAFATTTGTKIGTATTQKLAFWNATPIVQPTTAVTAATFVANTSAIANDTATFDGYTIGQVVKALRNIGLLA